MKVTVIGSRKLDFIDQNGNHIVGTQAFVSYPSPDFEGVQVDKIFLQSKMTPAGGVRVGAEYQADYNARGKLMSFMPVK